MSGAIVMWVVVGVVLLSIGAGLLRTGARSGSEPAVYLGVGCAGCGLTALGAALVGVLLYVIGAR